jgi:hypothetical protein
VRRTRRQRAFEAGPHRPQQLRLLDVDAAAPATAPSPVTAPVAPARSPARPAPAPDWLLDARTRRIGRAGVAAAKEALRRARPPEPDHHTHAA